MITLADLDKLNAHCGERQAHLVNCPDCGAEDEPPTMWVSYAAGRLQLVCPRCNHLVLDVAVAG